MTSFWEILKSSKNLKASDAFAELWGKSIADSWDIITITGTLPLTFEAKGEALTNYRLYGTSEGAGTETSGTEPAGYKIPLTVTSREQSVTYPIYIGDTKLYEEEYLDYESGKVYKRTENLLNPENAVDGYAVTNGPMITPSEGYSIVYIPCEPSTRYTGWNLATTSSASNRVIGFCDQNKNLIGNQRYSVTSAEKPINTTAETFYIAATVNTSLIGVLAMVTKGNTEPETYIPYLQPTDPPVPFPAITAYKGENTLTSTEAIGEVSVTGKIKEI
jgi:hypothetical protein